MIKIKSKAKIEIEGSGRDQCSSFPKLWVKSTLFLNV